MAKDKNETIEEVKKKVRGLGPVKLTILCLLAVVTICSYVFYDFIFGSKSFFVDDITPFDFVNNLWRAIPKLVSTIQIVTILSLIAVVLIAVFNKLLVKNQREVTVANLLHSIIKWITVIVMVIAVLAAWGVDTTALITGAGVVTLIVGLGMQSLIADVVAGLFIVFEDEFNVGDYITVDGFRGEVIEIGIRTTKLKAAGNIKIINNNEIKGVLNQTRELSVAKSFLSIEYEASLPEVEEIIKKHLPEIKLDTAEGQICYDGVENLGDSGITLQFSINCHEGDIFAVQREMNKKLKIMFDENGINIPYNQIVVHNGKN